MEKKFFFRIKVNLATLAEGNPKAPFSIATTLRCRGGRYSFPGLLHFFHIIIMLRHLSLSSIAPGRPSRLHPVSAQNCSVLVLASPPTFACLCEGVHRIMSLMSLPPFLQQCPACLVCLTWIVFMMGGRWPYSCYFVGCNHQDCSILLAAFLCSCRQVFSPYV